MNGRNVLMKGDFFEYSFDITPVFEHIQSLVEKAGLYVIHNNDAQRSLQFYKNKESYYNKERYLGAIQYEGSADYEKKEPNLVSWRFKRENIPVDFRQSLESITSFRRDKNKGPAVNPKSESIAFKFDSLGAGALETMDDIVNIIKRYY